MPANAAALVAITLGAAIVNGALGYGFSSITVPLALLFLSNRALNPALVLIEVPLNVHVVWMNRAALGGVWRRVVPVIAGLIPGVLVGTMVVSRAEPDWLKLGTYLTLLPLILLQAVGFRRPVRSERPAALVAGGGLGLLYSVTTISGPPLAMALSNQGLEREEFRAALGLVRLAESSVTAAAYLAGGLFVRPSMGLIPWIVPGVAVGVPAGTRLIRRLPPDRFRRICTSLDAWVVAFGLSKVVQDLGIIGGTRAWAILFTVVGVDSWLLLRFFSPARQRSLARPFST
jgi:uncharacterized protein